VWDWFGIKVAKTGQSFHSVMLKGGRQKKKNYQPQ
jgi:hypothetical protein